MKKYLVNFERTLILIIFPIMCGLIFIMTISRITNIATSYLTWAEEAARYLMIWMAFLSIGVVAKDNSHFRMTALVESLPPKASRAVNLLANILSVAIMALLLYHGGNMIMRQMKSGQLSPILKLPMWIPYLAIPVGILNMLIRTIIREWNIARGKSKAAREVAE